MKILHIYKDYFPILGGIENHVKLLAEGQAAAGHDVMVLVANPTAARTASTIENGVRVIRAGRLATVASTPLSLALPWQLLRQRPDVVHLHFPYPLGEASQWLLRRGQATVLSYHSDIVRQAGILRFYRPLLKRVLAAMNAIIVGSPPMRNSAYLADHQARLHLIPYGIPLARFQTPPTAEELARVWARHGAQLTGQAAAPDAQGSPLLLFVGRLRYYKGLDTLIRALPSIPGRLLVVGVGPMEATWKALAHATGVADRIAWLGEAADEDLPALYHLADLFVLPASHPSEAFGLVQVEAMAAGVPVVCTELGTGTSYVNQDGVTGRVVPPRDPAALAAAIRDLLADPDRLAAMSAAARDRAAAEFDAGVMIRRVLALYEEVLRFRPCCGKMS
ncbi:MAG: glycosyltransferase [Chloroflexi bacterium]|nr:glycosyltransferase [Chloroflexota bacterium]